MTTFLIQSESDFNTVVELIDSGSNQLVGTTTLDVQANITLTSDLLAITSTQASESVVIDGNGYTIDGAGHFSGLTVLGGTSYVDGTSSNPFNNASFTTTVTVNDLTLNDTASLGGNGGSGGTGAGGGAGLGGGLFVGTGASVSLSNVDFYGSSAKGGAGGTGTGSGAGGGGGGGGLGGGGGNAQTGNFGAGGGGGGIGTSADGGNGVGGLSTSNGASHGNNGGSGVAGPSYSAGYGGSNLSFGYVVIAGHHVREGGTTIYEYGGQGGKYGGGGGGGNEAAGGGGGISPTVKSVWNGFPSYLNGSRGYSQSLGGYYKTPTGFDHLSPSYAGSQTVPVDPTLNNYWSNGGNGGLYGGGGGAGGSLGTHGKYGSGANEGIGGEGGFAGGGGGGLYRGTGGTGGFGGGGGGGGGGFGDREVNGNYGYAPNYGYGGTGGFGAGSGSQEYLNRGLSGAGGGGLGAGGAIFVAQGGTLNFESGVISGATVAGGAGGSNPGNRSGLSPTYDDAGSGSAFGSGIFVQTNSSSPGVVTFAPPSEQTLTIDDVITDEYGSDSSYAGAGIVSVVIGGQGTVVFGVQNSYSGTTTIEAGATLELTADLSSLANGIIDDGTLDFGETASTTLSQSLSGNGVIAETGSATVTLTNFSNFAGSLDLTSGVLDLDTTSFQIAGLSGPGGEIELGSGGTLTLNSAGNYSFGGTIDPTVTLIQDGSGTQSLSGNIKGQITIASGAVALTGSAFDSSRILDQSELILDPTGNGTAGQLSGNGALVVDGSGTMTVASGTTFSGSTTITSGTLDLAGDVSHWSGAISVTNPGVLEFSPTGMTNFSSVISGNGGLEVNGSGTVAFGAAETISGGVTITSGTAVVQGDSSNFGSAILDDGKLVFGQTGNDLLTQTVSGTGTLDEAGSGTLTLGANEALTGTAEVDSGTFKLSSGTNLSGISTLSVQGGVFELASYNLTVPDLVGGGGTIDLGSGTLTAEAVAPGFNTDVIGSGLFIMGDGSTLDALATIHTNVGFGSNGALVTGAGSTTDVLGTITTIDAGVIIGNLVAGANLSMTNGGTISGRVSMTSGTVTNTQYYNNFDRDGGNWKIQQAAVLGGGLSATGSLDVTNGGTIQNGITLGSGSIVNSTLFGPGTITPSSILGGITASGALYFHNGGIESGNISAGGVGTIINVATGWSTGDLQTSPVIVTEHPATISGNVTLGGANSTVDNSGSMTGGVTLQAGGTIFNRDTGFDGSAIGSATIDGSGLLDNEGIIGNANVSNGARLENDLVGNGDVTITGTASVGTGSYLTNASIGTIANLVDAGTAVNSGLISGTASVQSGGMFTQQGGGAGNAPYVNALIDAGIAVNKGLLNGVSVALGGTLTNNAGASIQGQVNVAGQATNDGTIAGGVSVQSTGSVFNDGRMTNGETDNGYFQNTGYLFNAVVGGSGSFTNLAGATVGGYGIINGGTLTNFGALNADITIKNGGLVDVKSGAGVADADVLAGGTLELEAGSTAGPISLDGGTLELLGDDITSNIINAESNSRVVVAPGASEISMQGDGSTTVELLAGNETGHIFWPFSDPNAGVGAFVVDAGANWGAGLGAVGNIDVSGSGTLTFAGVDANSITNSSTLGGSIIIRNGMTNLSSGVVTAPIQLYGGVLDNAGSITNTVAARDNGIAVTNQSTGTINGLTLYGAGSTLTNFGTVGSVVAGYVTNYGTIGSFTRASYLDNKGIVTGGVSLRGDLVNAAGASIEGAVTNITSPVTYISTLDNLGTINGITNFAGTLTNQGLINGSVGDLGGVLINASGATITGDMSLVDRLDATSTATNSGLIGGNATIQGSSPSYNVVLSNHGTIDGTVFNTGATVDNFGAILDGLSLGDQQGLGYLTKVVLEAGSSTGGSLKGSNNVVDTLEFAGSGVTASSVTDFGTIALDAGASVTLTGNSTITGLTPTIFSAATVTGTGTLNIAGTLTNSTSWASTVRAVIEAGGTLINEGTTRLGTGQIGGPGDINGVSLTGANAVLINQANGVVTGGVTASGTGDIVNDAGTITGGLTFSGENETLALGAGASIDSITTNSDHSTSLELSGTGNLQDVGVDLAAFGGIIIDAGGDWTTGGNFTIAQPETLSGGGTLAIDGTLTNNSTLTDSLLLSGGTVINNGSVVGLDTDATSITNASTGTISGGVTLAAGELLTNDGTFAGTLHGGTLDDFGLLSNATIASGTLRLEAGYSTSGVVTGSGGAVLDLAGSGTLDGLGTEFVGFNTIETDGNWTLGGDVTLSGSTTFTGSGTLTVGGALSTTGTLLNDGDIAGTVTATAGGTVTNAGSLGTVDLTGTGSELINQAAGDISGGVTASGNGEIVVDNGTIGGNGVSLLGTGDTLQLADGALPASAAGVYGNGDVLELGGTNADQLSGLGTSVTGFDTIKFDSGSNWQLGANNTLAHTLTLSGASTLAVASGGALTIGVNETIGVDLSNNASFTNETGVTLDGTVNVQGPNALVSDYGTITGAIDLNAGGDRVVLGANAVVGGGINASSDGSSTVQLDGSGGTLDIDGIGLNGSGTIDVNGGTWTVSGVLAAGKSLTLIGGGTLDVGGLVDNGTITNQTTLQGTLDLGNGASLINQGTASGVDLSGAATLSNSGAIGFGDTAVTFTGNGGRLIESPSGGIDGSVTGSSGSTLELFGTYAPVKTYGGAYGAAYYQNIYGKPTGFGGLGTQITNFGTTTVDHGASWELTGANTIAAGDTFINNGLLLVDQPLVDDGTVVNNAKPGTYNSYLLNSGGFATITPGLEGSVTVEAGGSLLNEGVLGGFSTNNGVVLSGGSLTNASGASIEGNPYGLEIAGSGDFRNAGVIKYPNGVYTYQSGSNIYSEFIQGVAPVAITQTIQPGDTVSGYGVINTIIGDNDGVIRAEGGRLEVGPAVTGTGDLEIASGATLQLDHATSEAIVFDGGGTNETLVVAPGNAQGDIDGFIAGDTIALEGAAGGSIGPVDASPEDTFVTILGAAANDLGTLDLHGDYPLGNLALDASGDLTTTQDVPCYCPGTLIQTKRGHKRVEKLKIGDKVMTMSGVARLIKWVGRRSYSGRFIMGRKDILPICIKAGALADKVPKRDLWISPNHAMYFSHAMYFKDARLDGVLIEAKNLVNGVSIVQADHVDKIDYIHVELETHDVIIAEGALAESFIDDDSRGLFNNAHEYGALYPEVQPALARYCAPRCEDGHAVETVRRRIALRTGLLTPDEKPRLGALRGYVDLISADRIAGWAQNLAYPEAPVCLGIYVGGRLIGQVLANRYREDLQQAGLGSGRHSFEFMIPAGSAFAPDAIEVRRSLDGAGLELSVDARRELHRLSVLANKSGHKSKAAAGRRPTVKMPRRAASR